MSETKPGWKTSEVYMAGGFGAAVAEGLARSLESGQEIAAVGCAIGLGMTAAAYIWSRAKAKGGHA